MPTLTKTATSAAEAEAMVRALAEGRVRITPRPAAGGTVPVEPSVSPALPPNAAETDNTSLTAALARLMARGLPFDVQDVRDEYEGFDSRWVIKEAAEHLVGQGCLEKLPPGDARRSPLMGGTRAWSMQWLPTVPPIAPSGTITSVAQRRRERREEHETSPASSACSAALREAEIPTLKAS